MQFTIFSHVHVARCFEKNMNACETADCNDLTYLDDLFALIKLCRLIFK